MKVPHTQQGPNPLKTFRKGNNVFHLAVTLSFEPQRHWDRVWSPGHPADGSYDPGTKGTERAGRQGKPFGRVCVTPRVEFQGSFPKA